jgi:L-ascorbate 6-phosphate lactonase
MSVWGDFLISEIQKYNVEQRKVVFWSIGGSGFIIKTAKKTIYIDPYFGGSDPFHEPPIIHMIPIPFESYSIKVADIVLCTHEHIDHCHKNSLLPIYNNTKAIFLGPKPVIKKMMSWGFREKRLKKVKNSSSMVLDDIKINVTDSHDPQVEEAVTYIIHTPGATFFHTGDSQYFDGFLEIGNQWNIDFAFINSGRNPPGKNYYMTPCDFLQTAKDLATKRAIPMHWDLWKFSYQDPVIIKELKKYLFPEVKILIMRLGDKYIWPKE